MLATPLRPGPVRSQSAADSVLTDQSQSFGQLARLHTKTLGMEIDYTDKAGWAQFKSGEDVYTNAVAVGVLAIEFRVNFGCRSPPDGVPRRFACTPPHIAD